MLVTEGGIVIVVSEVQSENAPSPMLVTDEGIVIEVNEVHSQNAHEPMLVSWLPSAKVTVVSEVQP